MNKASPDNSRTACCGDSTGGRPRLLSLLLGLLLLVIGGYVALADPARVPTGEIRFGDTGLLLVLGLFTGLHCIGMCGGMVLIYRTEGRRRGHSPLRMHTCYAVGKTLAYTALGALFGLLGSLVSFSPAMRGLVGVFFGGCVMLVGLGMVLPSPLNRLLARLSRSCLGRLPRVTHPFALGLVNGLQFLCGPLQAIYLLAAGTADPLHGGVLLLAFGLGTLPAMMVFAFFTDILNANAGRIMMKLSALLVLLFGAVTVNRGLALVGPGYDLATFWARARSMPVPVAGAATEDMETTQVVTMRAGHGGWSQDRLTLCRGIPTRWIIEADEITACNKTLMVPALGLVHDLKPGTNIIQFTPKTAGVFTFTCWMGMMKGVLVVHEAVTNAPLQVATIRTRPENKDH